jgi:hypothetical protein
MHDAHDERAYLAQRPKRGTLAKMCARAALAKDAADVHCSEKHEHDRDRQLHPQAEPGRDDDAKDDEGPAHEEECDRMPEAPHDPDRGCGAKSAFAADDRRHGADVIGVGCVTHPEEEAEG